MNLLSVRYYKVFYLIENVKSENLGFYFSSFLHLLILIVAIGIPNFFEPKPIILPTIIPIEIINIADVTSIPKKIKDITEAKSKTTKIKENKFNSSNNQEIKKLEIKKKPIVEINEKKQSIPIKENVAIKEKKINFQDKKIIKDKVKDLSNFESLPSNKIKPKIKPRIKKLNLDKPLNSDVIKKNKPKPPSEFNIASMLKDLRNEKSTKIIEKKDEKNKNIKDETITENENENEKDQENIMLSISEIDLVLQQLSGCFIAPAGAEIEKTIFVKVSAKIQRNRKVLDNSIRIIDTNISKSSSVYGPITESAMRTLLNPDCIPLKLPEDKYESWKNLTMLFDYSVMKGN